VGDRRRSRHAAIPSNFVRWEPDARPLSHAEWSARRLCALCGREARGFGYIHRLQVGDAPLYRFCSMACCEAGGALAERGGGVIDKTAMEVQAIKDARRPFAEMLQELDLLAPFAERPAAEIDRIIEACVDGFQASMQRQAEKRPTLDDDFPF
jgi:hypothetical protein